MRINRHDTNGTKPLLAKGELGYDDYSAGGDTGRVYVGTSTENIPLAKRLESNMMTKAQYNALAEERKANRAGSGFDELGKHLNNGTSIVNINDGIFVVYNTANANTLYLGTDSNGVGISKTLNPIININGVKQNIGFLNNSSTSNKILLPIAPNIYPHDTVLTPEQIASGVIKHADASNSGLIVNGKFDTDTSGWTSTTAILSVVSNTLKVQNSNGYGSANNLGLPLGSSFVAGKAYVIEFDLVEIFGGNQANTLILPNGASFPTNGIGRYSATFTANGTTVLSFVVGGNIIGDYKRFDNIAVYPADSISRSDLSLAESYHEDIAEKNIVYPLGNVQYLGGNTDGLTGIANGSFSGFETYSLFGNWQTPSALIGKGYVWSSLTETQKRAFISNPENNCYLDGDKTIQARYRARVVQGIDDTGFSNPYNNYLSTQSGKYIKPKGKKVSITSEFGIADSLGIYGHGTALWVSKLPYSNESGIFSATSSYDSTTGFLAGSYNGQCFAMPIALAHRRNQGMYHPVYNPNGSKKAVDGNFWYNTTETFTSISDCFNPAKLLTASGYIGTVSGRPDGLFYDQVHEGDITDLRNSSKKTEDYNRLISREFNKLVAGTYRGKEGENNIVTIRTFTKVSTFGQDNNRFYFGISSTIYPQLSFSPIEDNSYYLVGSNGSVYFAKQVINQSATGTLYVPLGITQVWIPIDGKNTAATMNTLFPDGTIITVIVSKKSTRTKSNTLLHCDIIGNPANYPTAWKQSGVFGTPLVAAEDGTSLLPNGTLDTFKLSRPVKTGTSILLALRSTDNGTTWSSFTPTFSTTTNVITLTDEPATNLVMVYYQTKTSMSVPTFNSEVLEIGDVSITNYFSATNLQSDLINKVNTHFNTSVICVGKLKLSTYTLEGNKFISSGIAYIPIEHPNANLGSSTSPLCKVLPYLTRLNGKAYLNLVFKEMKHNGTSWGDSNTFNIVDNVSTTVDNNGATILIGQKTVELPYFIDASE